MFRTTSSHANRTASRAGRAAQPAAFDAAMLRLESRTVMSGNGFYDAIELNVNETSGEASKSGYITGTGQRFFRFTADQDGLTALTVNPRIPLNATIELFDSSGRLLARPAVRAGSGQAEAMVFDAFEGRDYFVRVVGEYGTRGRFILDIDGAREIDTSHGDVSVRDRLNYAGDADGWNFTADRSGQVTITVDPTGSANTQIRLYDEQGRALTGLIDRSGSGGNEVITINVRAGDTYRVVVSGRGSSYGAYTITFDPHAGFGSGGTPWVTPISSTIDAAIDFSGDEDLYSFTAGRTGVARIIADASWGLDVILRVYTSSGSLIASHDRTGVSGVETIDLGVTAGRSYYIVVDGFRSTAGDYRLTLLAPTMPPPPGDDHADYGDWYDATRIPVLASSGNGLGGGAIEQSGDTDLFKFTAAGDGTLWIRINPHGSLDSIARVYDSRGVLIDTADAGGSGAAEWLRLDVMAGETFFLLVDGYGTSRGGYNVEIDGPSW